jgi:hypothetical protein
MTEHEEILESMDKVRQEHPYIADHRGTGYCSYASELLQRELEKKNIYGIILGGSWFAKTPEAEVAHDYAFNLITSIPDTDSYKHLLRVKEDALKYGRLNPKSGHIVFLLGKTIYDLTSDQFNFPEVYNISFFRKIFKKLTVCEVSIKNRENYSVTKSVPYNETSQLGIESW